MQSTKLDSVIQEESHEQSSDGDENQEEFESF